MEASGPLENREAFFHLVLTAELFCAGRTGLNVARRFPVSLTSLNLVIDAHHWINADLFNILARAK